MVEGSQLYVKNSLFADKVTMSQKANLFVTDNAPAE